MSTVVKLAPEYFPDPTKGRPVSSGSLYIGVVDLDPETPANQQTVTARQESGVEVAMSQPIETSAGGVPLYNGSPVTLLVEAAYSLKLLDSSGTQVYYVPNNFGVSEGDTIYLSDYDGNFGTAFASIGAVNNTHLIVDTVPDDLTEAVEQTENITIEWRSGYSLGGAFTFTMNGALIAGSYELFESDITIEGSPKAQAYSPYWWVENTTPGTTDVYAGIAKAISLAAGSTVCKNVVLDANTNAIGTTIEINDSIFLYGQGQGYLALDYKTSLSWIGVAGQTMVDFTPASGDTASVKGGGISNMSIDGNDSAGIGLRVTAALASVFNNLEVDLCTDTNILIEGEVFGVEGSLQSCDFDMIVSGASAAGDAMRIEGDATANVSLNHFGLLVLTHTNGTGLDVGSSDGNLFDFVRIFRNSGGTGTGIILRSGTTTDNCRRNVFNFVQSSTGGLTSEGLASGAAVALNNAVQYYSLGNGSPDPVVEKGSVFQYTTDAGTMALHGQPSVEPTIDFKNTRSNVGGVIGATQYKAFNDNDEDVTYSRMLGQIVDPADGAEDGRITFNAILGGSDTTLAYIGAGLVVGTPTGADKGFGTINASAVYDDNVLLTDYVHDAWLDGEIDLEKYDSYVPDKEEVDKETGDKKTEKRTHYKARRFAETAQDQLDTEKWVEQMKLDRKLPAFPGPGKWKDEGILSTGDMIQRLWETVEVQAIHIAKLHERIKALEE